MLAAGLDFEATSVDPKTAHIIEVGCILFQQSFKPLEGMNALVNPYLQGFAGPLDPEVTRVTGLTDKGLVDVGHPLAEAIGDLARFTETVDVFIAHNSAYDGVLLKSQCLYHSFDKDPLVYKMLQKPWLCTMSEVEYAADKKCRKLSHLALDHGLSVDPSKLHRAVQDVELMGRLLESLGRPLEDLLAHKDSPWVYLQAVVKAPWEDSGASTSKAKELGYSWQVIRGTELVFEKKWVKRVKEVAFDKTLEAQFFPIRQLKGAPHASTQTK